MRKKKRISKRNMNAIIICVLCNLLILLLLACTLYVPVIYQVWHMSFVLASLLIVDFVSYRALLCDYLSVLFPLFLIAFFEIFAITVTPIVMLMVNM